ncbi:hypothetical protein MNBD_ALPHA09-1982 [hydrothermal vent metagenome]|uniref:Uncharacterized protein n=1 Tax=hydrothermal vent metagenome TaxID=652676 RepID=A0A3B0TUP8_9ZZZZ
MNTLAATASRTQSRVRALCHAFFAEKGDAAAARRGAAFAFAIRIASAAIAYFSQILLARWMGGNEYGVFAYVWVWLVVLGTLTSLGLNSSSLRFIPQYVEQKNAALERGFVFGSRLFALGLSTAVAAIGALALYWGQEIFDPEYVVPLYMALVCLPMFTLMDTQEGTARAYSWIDLALLPPYIARPILLLMFLAAAVWLGLEPSAETAVLAAIAATWVAAVGQTLALERRLKRTVTPGARQYAYGEWIKVSMPIFFVVAFFMLLSNTDVLVMKFFRPSIDVAMYFAAMKTTSLISFIYFAITAAYAHRFAKYDASGDMEGLAEVLREAVIWTFWPSLVAGVGILAVGWPLLWLFGEEFTAAYPVMFVLVIGLVARAAVGPIDYMLAMLGQQNACAGVLAFTVAVNLALNFMFIPAFGLMGAAVATTISTMLATYLLYRLAKRRLGLNSIFWKRRNPA